MAIAQAQNGLFALVGYRNFRLGLQLGGGRSDRRSEPRVVDVSYERIDAAQVGTETRAIADTELARPAIAALTPAAVYRLERPTVAYKPSLRTRRAAQTIAERAPSGGFVDTAV